MDALKKLYHAVLAAYDTHGTIYRLYWTLLQFGAGAAVAALAGNPVYFPLATAVAVIITSEARKRLSPA